jgi:hypothetical protein
MLRIQRVTLGLLAIATVAGFDRSAAAQAGTCVYVRCALSLQQHPPRVVQGVAATPVANFGMFAPRIDLLTGSDSARVHYEAFRGAYNRSAVFRLVGFAIDISSLIVFIGNPRANHGTALGLAAVGISSGIGAVVFGAKAQSQLEQSIGFYNRALPDAP